MEEPQSPRVTALVVSRNGADELRRCLEQLEASEDRERLEVLVADDGSTDGTIDVPADFPSVIHLRLPKRLGWTRAVNIGLRTAKGDLVFLLPQTTVVASDTIRRLADRLESSTETGAVVPAITQAWNFPSSEQLSEAWKIGTLPGGQLLGPGETSIDYPGRVPVMLRRQFLRGMNYLNERFGDSWAELELCSRIRDSGKTIVSMGDVPVESLGGGRVPSSPAELADSAHGIATWIGLHHGFGAALRFRLSAALYALGRGRTSAFAGILGGTKIDGNQE